jgi:cytosine permease
MAVGAILALSAGTWDLAFILRDLGLGMLGLAFLTVVQWTTSDNALYSAGLALANLFDLKSKFWVTLVAGSIGTILATAGIYNHIISYIVFLGALIMPLAGILIVDYQFFRTKYKVPHQNITKQISIPALVAWVVGFIVAKFVTWGSPAINSLLVSGFLHFALSKLMGADVFGAAVDKELEEKEYIA